MKRPMATRITPVTDTWQDGWNKPKAWEVALAAFGLALMLAFFLSLLAV
jgi:hypothetical protein